MKMMQKTQCGSGYVKATEQMMGSSKDTGKLERGKDLRQNKAGGTKAKGSI